MAQRLAEISVASLEKFHQLLASVGDIAFREPRSRPMWCGGIEREWGGGRVEPPPVVVGSGIKGVYGGGDHP